MRKAIIVILITLMVGTAFAIDAIYTANKAGAIVQPGQLHTGRNAWAVVDTTLSAGLDPNTLAVGERTYVTVAAAIVADSSGDGKITIYTVPTSWNYGKFRCIGITNDNDVIYEIYLGTLAKGTDCELSYAGELAFTIGTQASVTSTYEMADTVVVTDGETIPAWSSSSPANNGVAEARIDLETADIVVAVPTTVECNCKLLMTGR